MNEETTERCRVCLEHKNLDQMKKRLGRHNGVDTLCKPCRREKEYFRVHGVERPKDLTLVFKTIAGAKHKRCSICSEYKTYDIFGKSKKNQEGITSECKPCRNEVKKQYRLKNANHVRQLSKEWIKNNYGKNKIADKMRGEKYRKTGKFKTRTKLERVNLGDGYVRNTLASRSPMKGSEFPQEMVETYRELMKLRKFMKENTI